MNVDIWPTNYPASKSQQLPRVVWESWPLAQAVFSLPVIYHGMFLIYITFSLWDSTPGGFFHKLNASKIIQTRGFSQCFLMSTGCHGRSWLNAAIQTAFNWRMLRHLRPGERHHQRLRVKINYLFFFSWLTMIIMVSLPGLPCWDVLGLSKSSPLPQLTPRHFPRKCEEEQQDGPRACHSGRAAEQDSIYARHWDDLCRTPVALMWRCCLFDVLFGCFFWIDGGPAAHVFDTFTVYWWSLSFSCRVPQLLMHHSEQHLALLFEGFNFLDIWGFAKMGVPPNHQF